MALLLLYLNYCKNENVSVSVCLPFLGHFKTHWDPLWDSCFLLLGRFLNRIFEKTEKPGNGEPKCIKIRQPIFVLITSALS